MKKQSMDRTKGIFRILAFATSLALIIGMISVTTSSAKTAQEINSEVNAALELFLQQVKGGKEFLNTAKGVLIIPNIVKVGVDGSAAFIDVGTGKSIDTVNIKDPIVAFMFGQRGLMANATIEGAKFTKLVR